LIFFRVYFTQRFISRRGRRGAEARLRSQGVVHAKQNFGSRKARKGAKSVVQFHTGSMSPFHAEGAGEQRDHIPVCKVCFKTVFLCALCSFAKPPQAAFA
jgi:hypothetical protein